jgi:hypothetical protein
MPVDKLILLSRTLSPRFHSLAVIKGEPSKAYRFVVDLSKTDTERRAILHSGGKFNGIHKLEFLHVAHLGLRYVDAVANEVFGNTERTEIFRIDFCVDILGVSIWQFAEAVLVENVQSNMTRRNRGGISLYPHLSAERKILIYERAKYLKWKKDPLARLYGDKEMVRFEVQFAGRGVPFPAFSEISRHADIDLLHGVTFKKLRPISTGLTPVKKLAAERLETLRSTYGLQMLAKKFTPPQWAALKKSHLIETTSVEIPDVRESLRRSVMDWLNNIIRFARVA